MPGKQFVLAAVGLALAMSTGCCYWADKWCPQRSAVAAAPVYYPGPAAAPSQCCVPCCPPGSSGYPVAAPAPAGTWTQPRGGACTCP